MNPTPPVWLAAITLLLPAFAAHAGQTAQVRMDNQSIRMRPGTCNCGFSGVFHLYFSSFYTEDVRLADGELHPVMQPAPASHGSYLILEDVSLATSVMAAYLNVCSADGNGDGQNDFFDVNQGASCTATGAYPDPWGGGYDQITARWSRNPGSGQGTCDITLNDPILGPLGPFHHTFELTEYKGTLTYVPGSNTVSGTVMLSGVTTATQLAGGAEFMKSSTDRLNVLELQSGTWTRSDADPLSFDSANFTRDPSHPDTYVGQMTGADGGFRVWTVVIHDPNDSDQNGVPDLSDDPVVIAPRRPQLWLAADSGHLRLTISGEVGRTHLVQEAASPAGATWSTVQTLTLTADPQLISLPLPDSQTRFWRVEAR